MTDENGSITQDCVDVIVLVADDGDTVPVMGRTAVELSGGHPLPLELLADLMDSRVRISADEGHPPAVLDELRAITVPPAFAAAAWLAQCRPVVIREGAGRAGCLPVRYSHAVGLRISYPEANDDHDDQDR